MERGSMDAWMPTEYMEKGDKPFTLQPKGVYRLFFAPYRYDAAGWTDWLRYRLRYFRFVPGTYPITVEAKYWDQQDLSVDNYRTVVESTPVDYAAPLSIILIGAVLGGFLFTCLKLVRSAEQARGEILKQKAVAQLAGSALLSVTVTVLLSRISETQFLIQVSVADFWGAILIGFLANYGGWPLLDKMIPPVAAGAEQTAKRAAGKEKEGKERAPEETPLAETAQKQKAAPLDTGDEMTVPAVTPTQVPSDERRLTDRAEAA
jgi:hypothetical protein